MSPGEPRSISIRRARQLAVTAQLLSAPRPRSILEVVEGLGSVQMDPTRRVARTEHLVLWSRLGRMFRVAELERLLWQDRSLFEYRAFILPTSQLAVHRPTMRRYPSTSAGRHEYVRRYLRENQAFRRYVLARLRTDGPLPTRAFEDRSAVGWRTGGWNDDGRNTSMMLEVLWAKGEVMIAGRAGQERVWDLAERRLPLNETRMRPGEEARRLLDTQVRALGIAKINRFGETFEGTRPSGWERALAGLEREGRAVRVSVDGLRGERWTHVDVLDRSFRPRTVLLSPFDRLIHDRVRAEELFDFRFRLEIYVPKAKREFGYFVMPILYGDRIVGRLDPHFDRTANVLRIDAVFPEQDAPASAWPAIRKQIDELCAWLGAEEVVLPQLPSVWR
ncbi:MAG TPA: crosslink repair DNA glycosylase YcaQ family protein [Actinomycetota bacterium]|nr:crosslink repair DNA glycosylase YcaQ family protein [Actinomycetota bacterium]